MYGVREKKEFYLISDFTFPGISAVLDLLWDWYSECSAVWNVRTGVSQEPSECYTLLVTLVNITIVGYIG